MKIIPIENWKQARNSGIISFQKEIERNKRMEHFILRSFVKFIARKRL